MPAKIYVVEDDDSIRMLLEVALRGAGFEPYTFVGASDALTEMNRTKPDACVLDIMLDGMDGIELLKTMRKTPGLAKVPVMMLTAKTAEGDKILGLDSGADDYMTKPFSVLELCARVRALLRRGFDRKDLKPELISGDLCMKLASREAFMGTRLLELTYKEFELLRVLMENAGRAVPREELLQDVWGYDFVGETRTLDMHVGTLRHKLGDEVDDPRYIKTVRGVGYRFIARVHTEESTA